jgi:hypothetical protein
MGARELLKAENDPFGPTYACLQARFAIEAFAYELLQDYLFEVSADAMNNWKPKAILKKLLYIDPDACSPISLTFEQSTEDGGPKREIHLGDSYRFSAAWANRMHDALGSFLHPPTIKQTMRGSAANAANAANVAELARGKAEEALVELERVLASTLCPSALIVLLQ